jgi:hypothetical protein
VDHALEQPPRGLTRRAKIAIVASLGSVILGVAFLPFLLMTLPDPHPVKVPGLSGERVGTYVLRTDGVYKLFPYTAPLVTYPADALVVDDPRPQVVVKYRQLDSQNLYGILRYDGGQQVEVDKTVNSDTKSLELRPKEALAKGRYIITAARDGADGGVDFFYFRVP